MKTLTMLVLLFLSATSAVADSFLVTLPQKLRVSAVIAHVKVVAASYVPPVEPTGDLIPVYIEGDYVSISSQPVEVYKGKGGQTISFRVHGYAQFEPKALPLLVGRDFIVFLHDPYENGELWLLEGPQGMRSIAGPFKEERVDASRKIVTDVYVKDEYLGILRKWEENSERKSAQPGATDNPGGAQ